MCVPLLCVFVYVCVCECVCECVCVCVCGEGGGGGGDPKLNAKKHCHISNKTKPILLLLCFIVNAIFL